MSKKRNKRNTKKFRKKLNKRKQKSNSIKVLSPFNFRSINRMKEQYINDVLIKRCSENGIFTDYQKSNNDILKPTELNDDEIKEKGIANGYDDLELYHITSSDNVESIMSNGLRGNTEPNKFTGLSKRGHLYTTASDSKYDWDKIKEWQLLDNESFKCVVERKPKQKDYSVLKIKGSTLKDMGIKITEDFNESIKNPQKCFRMFLGDKVIPSSEIEVVGDYKTSYEMAKGYVDDTINVMSSMLELKMCA